MHISLGHKKQREKHIKRFEDALTSSFFGTLRYLPPQTIFDFFVSLLGSKQTLAQEALSKLCKNEVTVEMNFWPNIAKEGRIEPDLMISLSSITFLIECKWDSGESSERQLLKQWKAIDERQSTFHIYLVKNLQRGFKCRDENIDSEKDGNGNSSQLSLEWAERILIVSWFDVLKAVPKLSISGLEKYPADTVVQWKKDMAAMFDRLDIREFGGFKDVSGPIEATKGMVFWNPSHGF